MDFFIGIGVSTHAGDVDVLFGDDVDCIVVLHCTQQGSDH